MLEGRRAGMGTVSPETIVARAKLAEQCGFDGLRIGEYIETQEPVARISPGRPPSMLAPIATTALLAATTTRVRISSSVFVAPYHDPLVLARELATIDQMSGGRMSLGLGIGGPRAAFARTKRVGAPADRSAHMEELVLAMRSIWQDDIAAFSGTYFGFESIETFPKPVQSPLPVWLAGTTDALLHRAARIADGWIGVANDPLGVPSSDIPASIMRLRELLAAEGRANAPFSFAINVVGSIAATREAAHEQAVAVLPGNATMPVEEFLRAGVIGAADDFVRRLVDLRNSGITEASVGFFEPDLDAAKRQIEQFAELVLPALR
jgi:probable F420-dependent oxidoreductase